VPLASPSRRVLGLLAAGTLGLSTAVLGAGVAQAADEVTGSADSAADPTWTVPEGSCLVEWVITGARGGDGDVPAEAPDERTVRTMVSGGDVFTLVPGSAGAAAPDGLGGTSSAGSGGYGGAAGVGPTAGGGGGASVVMDGEYVYLWADGGTGGGAGGGAGGTVTDEQGTGNFDLENTDSTVPTASPGPNGFISATAYACDAVDEEPVLAAPLAPVDVAARAGDRTITVTYNEDYADGVAQADSWEYRIGAGDWTPVAADYSDQGGMEFTLSGLVNGTSYTIRVRGVSDSAGPGAPSAPVTKAPFRPIGAPASVHATTGPAEVAITWTPPSAAGTFGLAGYEAVLMASFEEYGGEVYTCETKPGVRSCTVPAMPGDFDYAAVVYAVDTEGNRGEGSGTEVGVVPAPAEVPSSDGELEAPSATTGGVEAGEQVTFSGSGYAPFSLVTLLVYSEPQVIGTVRTDADGAFTATVTLPEGLPGGRHTLVAAGLDPSGQMRYMTLPITVTAVAVAVDQLAYTGADVTGPAIGGLAAVLVGSGLHVASRRRGAS
jgi:hypothetical protein